MFNSVNLLGNVATAPELRTTKNGTSVTNLRLAVNKPGKDAGADFFTIVLWEKQAEVAAEFCEVGSRIGIEGRLTVNSYTDKDDNKRRDVEISANRLHLLGGKRTEDADAAPEAEATESEIV